MRATSQEDERLVRLTKICHALPQTEREVQGLHASFKVKKKVFAYFLNDHHGDGIVGVTCKVLPGDNAALIKADPKRFYMPAYVGPRGWVGLRLDMGRVDWVEVQELVVGSYQLTAGKRLAGAVGELLDQSVE
jgi:predicted DNA-binding protein (MmcQ/YjbR family)